MFYRTRYLHISTLSGTFDRFRIRFNPLSSIHSLGCWRIGFSSVPQCTKSVSWFCSLASVSFPISTKTILLLRSSQSQKTRSGSHAQHFPIIPSRDLSCFRHVQRIFWKVQRPSYSFLRLRFLSFPQTLKLNVVTVSIFAAVNRQSSCQSGIHHHAQTERDTVE